MPDGLAASLPASTSELLRGAADEITRADTGAPEAAWKKYNDFLICFYLAK